MKAYDEEGGINYVLDWEYVLNMIENDVSLQINEIDKKIDKLQIYL